MSSSAPSFEQNLSKAASAMQGSAKDDSKEKKDEKDPMLEYGDQLLGLVTNMSGGSDTDMSPLSMLQQGADFLSKYSSDADKNNASPDQAKGMENSEELESAVTLAM